MYTQIKDKTIVTTATTTTKQPSLPWPDPPPYLQPWYLLCSGYTPADIANIIITLVMN